MKKTQPVAFFRHFRHAPKRLKAIVAVLLSIGTGSAGLQAQGPAGGVVRAGNVQIVGEGTSSTRIEQLSDRAIIDWRSFGIGAGDQVVFVLIVPHSCCAEAVATAVMVVVAALA